jgi:uncharacterized membrane protein YeaQ/YmgE (transglycosylase-associated protein family)
VNPVVFVVVLVVGGLVVGGLARLAVPGPDPMPLWATGLLGLAGALVGGLVTWALVGTTGGLVSALLASILLLVLYRRFVQKRGITGPAAKQAPTQGWWLPKRREAPPPDLAKLTRLRDAGVITPEEYAARRRELGEAD